MNYNLDSLEKAEAREYITGKLSGAECNVEVFNQNALEVIINASNEMPRIINKICNSSLMIGNTKNIIDNDIVTLAVNKTELG